MDWHSEKCIVCSHDCESSGTGIATGPTINVKIVVEWCVAIALPAMLAAKIAHFWVGVFVKVALSCFCSAASVKFACATHAMKILILMKLQFTTLLHAIHDRH